MVVTLALTSIFSGIVYIFYQNEIQYWLPTPVPEDYVEVQAGTKVSLSFTETSSRKFLHFFNPNCPCSKFNMQTYRDLIRAYGQDLDCYVVVQDTSKGIKNADLDYLKELGVKIIVDKDKSIAKSVGVYSTPQIVLLDEENRLFYRGNYNLSRYCTNPQTDFARTALTAFLKDSTLNLPGTAFAAYGCVLERETH
jgi:hypothetical protein